jgi:hypothetical protein
MARNPAVSTSPTHKSGLASNCPGIGCVNASMDMLPAARGAPSEPPPSRSVNQPPKYYVLNAIFSNTPSATGGSAAHKIGNRRAHADASSNHP